MERDGGGNALKKSITIKKLWKMAKNNYRHRLFIIDGIVRARKDFALMNKKR